LVLFDGYWKHQSIFPLDVLMDIPPHHLSLLKSFLD
jgi:hypothetical protein